MYVRSVRIVNELFGELAKHENLNSKQLSILAGNVSDVDTINVSMHLNLTTSIPIRRNMNRQDYFMKGSAGNVSKRK